MDKKKRIIVGVAAAICVVCAGIVICYKNATKISVKENIVLEFGEPVSDQAADYADLGSLVKDKATLDVSDVDNMKVGKYEIILKVGEKERKISVSVEDTRKPEIKLKAAEFTAVAGQELNASDMIEKITDLAGIRSVTFKDHMAEQDTVTINEAGIPDSKLKYDEEGEFENTVIAEDNNGLKQEVGFVVNVRTDYASHVQGLADITLEQGQSYDWMTGVSYDERIKEIRVNADAVDINTPGEYEIIYVIIGDDSSETEIRKKVIVEEPWTPSAEEVKALIVQYYNNQSSADGNYAISGPSDEFVETDTEYRAVVRYQMSDEEAENLLRQGRMPSANTLYTIVTVSKATWHAQDDLGNSWYLF